MTRPDEPDEDRTLAVPADPWPTIGRPAPAGPTRYIGGTPSATPAGPSGDATVRLGSGVHLGPGDAGPFPGRPTVPMGPGPGPADARTVNLDQATVHLNSPDTPIAGTLPDGSPTVRAQTELRFGPGVPAAPAAPAWPGTAGAGRRRPLWRRLVSLLSSLLTLVLIGVVGLYLWQRLRPLELEGVSVAVPEPAGTRCDVTVNVVATVRTNGRSGVIRYQWFRSDAPPGAVLSEQLGSGQRTADLTLRWTFTGVGTTTETATVNILEPSPLQVGTPVRYNCRA